MIQIVLNGDTQQTETGQTLLGLVASLGLPAERVAIELDRVIVKRADWAATALREGSRVEVVQFVGGG